MELIPLIRLMLKLSDFDFYLPKELIAQFPAKPRNSSKLLVLNRGEKTLEHKYFSALPDYISAGDAMVLNDTKVYPARLFGTNNTNQKRIEILLLKELEDSVFECLVKPSKYIKEKDRLVFGEGKLEAEILSKASFVKIKLSCSGMDNLKNIIREIGKVPLPPYIKREPVVQDLEDYQTIYAREEGAVAAPTAGLHFTPDLLAEIENKKVRVARLTLHTGYGTFAPVREENPQEHKMHGEYFSVSQKCADLINETRKNGKKVFAVGTTTTRALESAALTGGKGLKETGGETELFIYPPYNFKIVDALVTNFHLPKTTLLMMVAAFCQDGMRGNTDGVALLKQAYEEAVKLKYRFYSYGDAMLII